jgi:hypothetical protein
MGHPGRSLLTAFLALMAVMLLVAGTRTWTMRAHVTTCVATKDYLGAICEVPLPVRPGGQRLHPLRAELLWAGGLAAGAGALVLAAAGRRREPRLPEPAGG